MEYNPIISSFYFENLCITKKGEFTFHTKDQHVINFLQNHIYKKGNELISNFDNIPISFTQNWINGDRGAFKLKIVNDEIPTENSRVKFVEKTVLLMNRYASGNVGHFLVDNLAGSIELFKKYNIPLNDWMFLYLDEINYKDLSPNKDMSCSHNEKEQSTLLAINPFTGKQLFCKEEMSSYLYDKKLSVTFSLLLSQIITKNTPILQKCNYDILDNLQNSLQNNLQNNLFLTNVERAPCPRDDFYNKNRNKNIFVKDYNEFLQKENEIQICFKKVIFGTGDRHFVENKEKSKFREITLLNLRKTILKNLNLYKNIKNSKNRKTINIGIHVKSLNSKHGSTIYNLENLIKTLQETLQKNVKLQKIEIKIIPIILEKLTILEQVNLFTKIDIFITTPGSASYYSLFMPENSHLIYTPVCITKKENDFYCFQPTIHVHFTMSHLQVIDGLYLVESCKERKNQQLQWCDAVLNVERTSQLVLSILKMKFI
ncbi:hypothetical protein ABK040_001967 [Willaertia magna]